MASIRYRAFTLLGSLPILPLAREHQGGYLPLLRKVIYVYRYHGLDGIAERVEFLRRLQFMPAPGPTVLSQGHGPGRTLAAALDDRYDYRAPERTADVSHTIASFARTPLISIVMPVYNVQPYWLRAAVGSVTKQWYTNWELCICDDGSTDAGTIAEIQRLEASGDHRIKVVRSAYNNNISAASNMTLRLASGEFIALLDHDDELTADALYEVVRVLQDEAVDFVYSDEDKIETDGTFVEPHFKPSFAPDLFLCQNYISHLSVLRRELVLEVGCWEQGLEGAQDYDLYLKVLERTQGVRHVPKVLYHWRKVPGSTAIEFSSKSTAHDAGRESLTQAIRRRHVDATVTDGATPGTYRVRYGIEGDPLVSIVVLVRDAVRDLDVCLDSVLASEHDNMEVVVVTGENALPRAVRNAYATTDAPVRFCTSSDHDNPSRALNAAVQKLCRGDYLVFLDADLEVSTRDWIASMLEHAQRASVGAVGARLLYSNGNIHNAGIVLTPRTTGTAFHAHQNLHFDAEGYFCRSQSISNYSAVTAALMMVSRANFDLVGGFDDARLPEFYADIDFCLRLRDKGKTSVYTPWATATYHKLTIEPRPDSIKTLNLMAIERSALRLRHPETFEADADPFHSPNLSQWRTDFWVDAALTGGYKSVTPQPFDDSVIVTRRFREAEKRRACVFAHFDKRGVIAPYVTHMLRSLSDHCDIIFVSTARKLPDSEFDKISDVVCAAISRNNIGYDFGSWKTGLREVDLEAIDQLILCNDSSFGPFNGFETFFERWAEAGANVFGISDSFEVSPHLQSYFVGFDRLALSSDSFRAFWDDYGVIEDKLELVRRYEVGLTRAMRAAGLSVDCMNPALDIGYMNNTHYEWRSLLQRGSPFLKIELVRDNPMNLDLGDLPDYIRSFDYPIELIDKELGRVGKKLDDLKATGGKGLR